MAVTRSTVNGKPKHIISYLQGLPGSQPGSPLPAGPRIQGRSPAGRAQPAWLLAKIFLTPANVLVLDEPTNDLDVETLELLEELLLDYQCTLLLVSHDRDFLDHAVTSCLVFEGDGRVGDYVGGYSDWERMHKQALQKSAPAPAKLAKPAARAAKKASV